MGTLGWVQKQGFLNIVLKFQKSKYLDQVNNYQLFKKAMHRGIHQSPIVNDDDVLVNHIFLYKMHILVKSKT